MNQPHARHPQQIAVIGAGLAGLACARTLAQAGHTVSVFEAAEQVGGRLAGVDSPFGAFDTGAQYFTVRDPRFSLALQATAADITRRWSANAVRVLDGRGHVVEAPRPQTEAHWVAAPSMQALAARWAQPLQAAGRLHLGSTVQALETDPLHAERWQVRLASAKDQALRHGSFDNLVLALPAPQAQQLLASHPRSQPMAQGLQAVRMAPCWTLMLAFPQAVQPGLHTLGPQWNAARSTHHRLAWLARESSKPERANIERWTVQANALWSQEHAGDSAQRVADKLRKAFAEITGIHATPAWSQASLWPHARTLHALGRSYLWQAGSQVGVCGDWCLGHRVEDAFVSGLELGLRLA